MRRFEHSPRQSGSTVIEFAIYTVLLVIFGYHLVQFTRVSTRAATESDVLNRVLERNRTVLWRIVGDVRNSMATELNVLQSGKTLTLILTDGYSGTSIVPGNFVRYRLETASGESPNGVDDNGNGLIDEGQLVRQDVTNAEEVTISQGIDLSQSSFTLSGSTVTIQLTTHGWVDQSGSTLSATSTIAATSRN